MTGSGQTLAARATTAVIPAMTPALRAMTVVVHRVTTRGLRVMTRAPQATTAEAPAMTQVLQAMIQAVEVATGKRGSGGAQLGALHHFNLYLRFENESLPI